MRVITISNVLLALGCVCLTYGNPFTRRAADQSHASTASLATTSIPTSTTLTRPSLGVVLIPLTSPTSTPSGSSVSSTLSAVSFTSQVTAAPQVPENLSGLLEGEVDVGVGAKFQQTTYWSCRKWTYTTACGWHEPILDAGAGRRGCDGVAFRAGVVAGAVVVGRLIVGN